MRVIVAAVLAGVIFLAGALSRPLLSRVKHGGPFFVRAGPNAVAEPEYYERKSSQYAELHENRSIVFLGDSRVEGAEWSELFNRCDISNRGISGDTTAGILKRLSTSMPNDAALCVIQVGVNDLTRGVPTETVVANYERILRYLTQERHCRVVLTSVLLVRQERIATNAQINECNRALAELAARMEAQWVDVNALVAPDGFLLPACSTDGLHLNGKGYLRMRDALAPYLSPVQ